MSSACQLKFYPSEQQIKTVYSNIQYVIDKENKLNKETELLPMLFQFKNPRILLSLFLINTCEEGLSQIDSLDQKKLILESVTNCVISLQEGDKRILEISQKILDIILQPIPIKQNAEFINIWADLLQEVVQLLEFNQIADNFPYCLYSFFE